MTHIDIIRAWKDAEYRDGLSEAERAGLPQHPAGLISLSDDEMDAVVGAGTPFVCTPDSTFAWKCCPVKIVAPGTSPTRPAPAPGISVPLPPPSIVGS
jgi:mersacidin/lichenicidin family type 2 lantibiotic